MIKLIFGIRFPTSGIGSLITEITHTSIKLDDCSHTKKEDYKFCPECGKKVGVYKEARIIEYKLMDGFEKLSPSEMLRSPMETRSATSETPSDLYYRYTDNIFGPRYFPVQRLRDTNFNEHDYLILYESPDTTNISHARSLMMNDKNFRPIDLEVNLKILNKISNNGVHGDAEGVFVVVKSKDE